MFQVRSYYPVLMVRDEQRAAEKTKMGGIARSASPFSSLWAMCKHWIQRSLFFAEEPLTNELTVTARWTNTYIRNKRECVAIIPILPENWEEKASDVFWFNFPNYFPSTGIAASLFLGLQLSPSQHLWEDRKREDNLHLKLMVSWQATLLSSSWIYWTVLLPMLTASARHSCYRQIALKVCSL